MFGGCYVGGWWRIQPKIATFYFLGCYLFNQSLQKSVFFSFSKRELSFKIQPKIQEDQPGKVKWNSNSR